MKYNILDLKCYNKGIVLVNIRISVVILSNSVKKLNRQDNF